MKVLNKGNCICLLVRTYLTMFVWDIYIYTSNTKKNVFFIVNILALSQAIKLVKAYNV